jgi:hypothetical protein
VLEHARQRSSRPGSFNGPDDCKSLPGQHNDVVMRRQQAVALMPETEI